VANKKDELIVSGRRIPVSNLDKVLYPGGHFTKAKVIDYYIRIANYLLPHLKSRPVTLKRFPYGIYGEFFYEKDAPTFTPDWVQTFPVPRRERNGPDIRYILINDLATLVWLANLTNLELHPFLHRAPHIRKPDGLVFDLDPGEGANILTCARVALMLRELLVELKLKSLVKVSGAKGLQLYVPLNTRASYDQTQTFARAIATLLAQQHPNLIVAAMSKALRKRKVFIDWSQNDDYKTTVGVYSLRAKYHRPYVSVPIEWVELEDAISERAEKSLYFTPEAALTRAEKFGDLFAPALRLKQKLPVLETEVGRSVARKVGHASRRAVRRSRQGGRRRFVIEKNSARGYVFRLEMDDMLKSWSIPALPSAKRTSVIAKPIADAPVEERRLTEGPYTRGKLSELGIYDLIEGSYERDFLHLYLKGKKLEEQWKLQRDASGESWTLELSS
jgi:bifunctional non-homologous end joining protein LigD